MNMEWTGPYPVEQDHKRYADDITLQELVRLRVENERFRKALQDCIYVLGQDGAIEGSLRVMEIASSALGTDL